MSCASIKAFLTCKIIYIFYFFIGLNQDKSGSDCIKMNENTEPSMKTQFRS